MRSAPGWPLLAALLIVSALVFGVALVLSAALPGTAPPVIAAVPVDIVLCGAAAIMARRSMRREMARQIERHNARQRGIERAWRD
jgi:lipopolysaccharide export LptBFGC system permease protein LptF